MIKQTTFKAGDLVYYPSRGTEIYKLQESNRLDFPLEIKHGPIWMFFRSNGRINSMNYMTQLVHATEENRELLSRLYGMEFESTKPTPYKIIKHLLTKQKLVVCAVSDENEESARESKIYGIVCFAKDGEFIDAAGYDWKYAIPIDLVTGKEITEIEE